MKINEDFLPIVESKNAPNNKKYWFQKGKNRFNIYNTSIVVRDYEFYYIENENKIIVKGTGASTWTRAAITVYNLAPNTKYHISTDVTNPDGRNAGLIFPGPPEIQSLSANTSFRSSLTFTADANGTALLYFMSNWSSQNLNSDVTFDNIIIEQGENFTSYEPYMPDKIQILNSNNTYEIFYNEDLFSKKDKLIFEGRFTEALSEYFTFDSRYQRLQKTGSIICFYLDLHCKKALTTNGGWGDPWMIFPEGFRPPRYTLFSIATGNQSDEKFRDKCILMGVTASGAMSGQCTFAVGDHIQISGMFFGG